MSSCCSCLSSGSQPPSRERSKGRFAAPRSSTNARWRLRWRASRFAGAALDAFDHEPLSGRIPVHEVFECHTYTTPLAGLATCCTSSSPRPLRTYSWQTWTDETCHSSSISIDVTVARLAYSRKRCRGLRSTVSARNP
jgi:hypothetical protein